MTAIVVAHDLGRDATPWRDALRDWPDDVAVPELVVRTASGDRTDVVWLLLEHMETWRSRAPVMVGCGEHALAAETFALAGWLGRLVLVDGLGGPWMSAEEQVDAQHAWLREKLADPERPGYPRVWVEGFAESLRGNVHCPVLLIETPASITPADEVERRAGQFRGPTDVVRLDDSEPARLVAELAAWVGS